MSTPRTRPPAPLVIRVTARPRWLLVGGLLGLACASPAPPPDATRYRLAGSGSHWDVVGRDRVLEDVQPRYADFFRVVLDPARSDEPPTSKIRRDLEHAPVDRRNYDALNAVAIGYFELNYRGEAARGSGSVGFMSAGFRTAKLAAIPWRAYGEIQEPALRDAILDFFEDAATGEKLGASATAGRLSPIIDSLVKKEADPARRARIEALVAHIDANADR